MLKKFKRAFTITELVIVIAVIAILAAVLIPTFSHVIDNSKKSHDVQYVKELNVALTNYTIQNKQKAPKDYEELMLALAEYNLCDASNPFLLGTKLKQKDQYIIWYKNLNQIIIVDASPSSEYIVSFSNVGEENSLGNAVSVFNKAVTGKADKGYLLCTAGGDGSGEIVAKGYYDLFVTNGGDISSFLASSAGQSFKNDAANMGNTAWGNSIIGAMNNQNTGYIASESISNDIMAQAQSNETTLNVAIPAPPSKPVADPGQGATPEQKKEYNEYVAAKTATEQAVRGSLATMADLANDKTTAQAVQGKTISLAPKGSANPDKALDGVVVDMSEVQMAAIGTTYRKAYEGGKKDDQGVAIPKVDEGSFSVNFAGVKVNGVNVAKNNLVTMGAEYQTAGDNGYTKPAFMFTYGLFGTVHALHDNPVTISNLNIEDVHLDLNGATETINGEKVDTISDMAGIIAGYTQGDVTFENININGHTFVDGVEQMDTQGYIKGYDGVSAIVGRTYANKNTTGEGLHFRKVNVSNVDVEGQRRAAAFIGFCALPVEISDCTMDNINIRIKRTDGGSLYGGFLGDSNDNAKTYTINNLTATNITTSLLWSDGSNTYNFYEKGFNGGTENAGKSGEYYYLNAGKLAVLRSTVADVIKVEAGGFNLNGVAIKSNITKGVAFGA